ncbi:MAG: glycosyltransferase, partial [Muribaculaceae bacterium]|nr:glycosyltransferase [Muribaculaceae bacterium]
DTIRIVTSARFVRLKRLPETLEILGEAADLIPDRKIEWTIFGDGEELPRFKNQLETSQRPNLRVNIAGMTDNTEIQRQLASGEIHWFLLLSSTEGIPVSLGEAMSYGIPSIVTDVGQVTELATPQTSVIIEPELKERSRIAAKIAKALPDLELRSRLGRQSLRTWEMSFNADTRARHLANIIAGG